MIPINTITNGMISMNGEIRRKLLGIIGIAGMISKMVRIQ
jgi:hypothetical protein